MTDTLATTLERLEATIAARAKGSNADGSYVAKLLSKGRLRLPRSWAKRPWKR